MTLKPPWHSISLTPMLWSLDLSWCRVLQPGQGCLALGPGAPAGECGCTSSTSALAEAWRAWGCLALVRQPHQQSWWGGRPFSPKECNPSLPELSCLWAEGLDVALPTLLVEAGSGQMGHVVLDQDLSGAGEMWGCGRTLYIKFRPAVSPLCLYIFQ